MEAMRRVVEAYLRARIDGAAVVVVNTVVAADAREMLARGMVWSVRYEEGRLLAQVGLWALVAGGEEEVLAAWVAAGGGQGDAVARAVVGGHVGDEERAGLKAYDRALVAMADRMFGRTIADEEVETIARVAAEEDAAPRPWLEELRRLAGEPVGRYAVALTDEPIEAARISVYLEPYDYVRTGDHAGCLRLLDEAVAQAEAEAEAGERVRVAVWRRIAVMTRFLTGDDARAMAYLARARVMEAREDWIDVFGDAGRARVRREKEEVLAVIEAAFDGVPFPGPKARSLFQAEAADNWAGCDQSRDHKGRWQDLPREHVLACQFALPHLGAPSLRYYLPAILSFVAREHDEPRDDHGSRWIFESVEYELLFRVRDEAARARAMARYADFTPAQLGAVARFAEFYRCEPEDRARWWALARGAPWPAAG